MRRLPSWAALEARFVPEPNTGCWLWTGYVMSNGYGMTSGVLAHRATYTHLRGAIPSGLQIDHLCRVRSCVNPDHMETVTPRVNTLRGESPSARQARQTHCVHGHEFTAENTWTAASGRRQCRACWHRSPRSEAARERAAEYMRKWNADNREYRAVYNKAYRERRRGQALLRYASSEPKA